VLHLLLQGVLKVATLPDGASWIMPSPEHQQCAKVISTQQPYSWPCEGPYYATSTLQESSSCRHMPHSICISSKSNRMPSPTVAWPDVLFSKSCYVLPSACQAAHPEGLQEAHEAVLEVYRRQVTAARHMQQQQLLCMGDPAGAVLISEEVKPSEYVNDGYIWLALTHHLLGAGRLDQVGGLTRGYIQSTQKHLSQHEGSCWHPGIVQDCLVDSALVGRP